ncbi:MAG TPA: glycosyltransferase family 4 protein [Methanofastidiosum sp.]|nr:glycosyltransferase family 4 protein [Methanofastidiosum sp.]
MKNILVFSSFYKPHLGGVEKYVENFYQRLSNHKVVIITSKYDNRLKSKEKDGDLNIVRIDSIQILKDKYYIPTFNGYKKIKELIRDSKERNTEIHTHTRFYLTNFLATLLTRKYKVNHYHFEHGSSFVQDGSSIVRLFAYIFDQTLGKYILKKSDLVFPISEGVRKFLNKNYKNIKLGPTLYNSYDFKGKEYKNSAKPTNPKLLFVGRLVKSKGVYELVEAAKILKEDGFSFTLTFVGDGSEKESLERYIENNDLGQDIILKGRLPYQQTQLEFPKYDIFINPSYTEGLPTTVLEALFNNLLVVATDVGGTNEIIPKKLLINKEELSPNSLARQIKNSFNNWDKLKIQYEKIYKEDKEKFSWETNIEKYKDVMKHI